MKGEVGMKSKFFSKDTIFLDVPGDTINDIFQYTNEKFIAAGLVTNGFLDAIINRESKFPTGLQGSTYDIAVPHTDPEHVIKPFIGAVRTLNPIPMIEMATDNKMIYPRILFILGFKHGSHHLKVLKTIIDNFVVQDELAKIFLEVRNVDECLKLLQNVENQI